jgi:hypothetical protein
MASNQLIGTLTFADPTETDLLNNYRVKLEEVQTSGGATTYIPLTDSGILFSDNFNNFNSFIYSFKYGFEVGKSYRFTVYYQTNTLYQGSTTISFDVIQDTGLDAGFRFSPKIDVENGRIEINIGRDSSASAYTGKIVLRRTDSNSNFTI